MFFVTFCSKSGPHGMQPKRLEQKSTKDTKGQCRRFPRNRWMGVRWGGLVFPGRAKPLQWTCSALFVVWVLTHANFPFAHKACQSCGRISVTRFGVRFLVSSGSPCGSCGLKPTLRSKGAPSRCASLQNRVVIKPRLSRFQTCEAAVPPISEKSATLITTTAAGRHGA